MICPTCFGKGKLLKLLASLRVIKILAAAGLAEPPPIAEIICPECHGSGIASCCDSAGAGIAEGGETRQPQAVV